MPTLMKLDRVNKSVLLVMVFTISAVFLQMIEQFLLPVCMAGLFSAILYPLHKKLSKKLRGRKRLASAVIVLALLLLVFVPASFLFSILVGQALSVSQSVTPWIHSYLQEPTLLTKYLEKLPYYESILPYQMLIIEKTGMAVNSVSSFLIGSLSSMTKMTVSAIFSSLLSLYTMFYFFTVGDSFLKKLVHLIPMRNDAVQQLLKRFTRVTTATLKGIFVIGLIQGTFGFVAFSLVEIREPVFWSVLMAGCSVIPIFGSSLIWIPILAFLAADGLFSSVVIVSLLCGLGSLGSDNWLRPKLVGHDTNMHDLFVLFSTFGGIGMFGIVGIILGPIIASLFLTLWELYSQAFSTYLNAEEAAVAEE